MHPALRKGQLFTKKNTHPIFHFFTKKTTPIFHFFTKHPYFPLFFTKITPHFISCLRPCWRQAEMVCAYRSVHRCGDVVLCCCWVESTQLRDTDEQLDKSSGPTDHVLPTTKHHRLVFLCVIRIPLPALQLSVFACNCASQSLPWSIFTGYFSGHSRALCRVCVCNMCPRAINFALDDFWSRHVTYWFMLTLFSSMLQ